MKFEYNYENNDWKTFSELQGILQDRKILKENPQAKLKTYLGHNLEYIALFLIFIAFAVIIGIITSFSIPVIVVITMELSLTVVLALAIYLQLYSASKMKPAGTIEIKEDGIFDLSDGIGHFISWEKVDYIVIGKRTIVIIIDCSTPLGLFFDKELAPKLIKEIKKYKADILVVDKSK